jgi:hypothetical protein
MTTIERYADKLLQEDPGLRRDRGTRMAASIIGGTSDAIFIREERDKEREAGKPATD